MKNDVFICHASEDRAIANAICSRLEQSRIRCWIAPRDVLPGSDYAQSIVEAIAQTKLTILVFTRSSNLSPHVKREIERSASHGIPVLPFRVEQAEPSPSLEYFISDSHWLDAVTPPIERHLEYLAGTVRLLLDRELSAGVVTNPAQTPAPQQGDGGHGDAPPPRAIAPPDPPPPPSAAPPGAIPVWAEPSQLPAPAASTVASPSLSSAKWRWINSWWIFPPILSAGFLCWLGFLVAGINTGRRKYYVSAIVYAAVLAAEFALSGQPDNPLFGVAIVGTWLAPTIHAAMWNRTYLIELAGRQNWFDSQGQRPQGSGRSAP